MVFMKTQAFCEGLVFPCGVVADLHEDLLTEEKGI